MTKKAKPIILIVLKTLIEAMTSQLFGNTYLFSPAFAKLGHKTQVAVDVKTRVVSDPPCNLHALRQPE
jgi:hypothetical protein